MDALKRIYGSPILLSCVMQALRLPLKEFDVFEAGLEVGLVCCGHPRSLERLALDSKAATFFSEGTAC